MSDLKAILRQSSIDRDYVSSEVIADKILSVYSEVTLREQFHRFSWSKNSHEASVLQRCLLEKQVQKALQSENELGLEEAIRAIYKWGFKKTSKDFLISDSVGMVAIKNMMRVFAISESDTRAKTEVVTQALGIKGLGIASVSKWTCFVDQNRYAIYDSRVSLALRKVVNIEGKRYFPILPRRSTKKKKYPPGDYVSVEKMVNKYLLFNNVIKVISDKVGMSVSQVEIAFFMIGESCHD
jgi:hypothetical protein